MRALISLLVTFPVLAAADVLPPPSELPAHDDLAPLLVDERGAAIETREAWMAERKRLKAMLAYYQYGRMPPKPESFQIKLLSERPIGDGAALERTFRFVLRRNGERAAVRVGLVRLNRRGRFPVVIKNDRFRFSVDEIENPDKRAQYAEQGRGELARWVAGEALRRGYIYVKFVREDVAVDREDNRSTGVFPLYPEPEYDWGTIAAWAWFYQPLIDYLVEQDWVDPEKIVATGHSRGGKTALCAGVYEERIALTAPSASGSGGAGSWRFFSPGGAHQDVEDMTSSQPHWFTPRLTEFIGRDERLPVGSHTAKALIAARALFNSQGSDDSLSNPVGTRKTFEAAQRVFDLLGVPDHQTIHWRPGGHGQLREDWLALFDFADRVFFGKESGRRFENWP